MINLFCFLLYNSCVKWKSYINQLTCSIFLVRNRDARAMSVQEVCQFVILYPTVSLSLPFQALILPYDHTIFLNLKFKFDTELPL